MYDTKPKDGQSELSYLWAIGQAKDGGVYDGTWEDIADLINFYYRADDTEYKTSSAYRKPYEQAKKFYEGGVFSKFSEDEYVKKLTDTKRQLEREKVKVRDERRAWNKQNYNEARIDDFLEQMADSLRTSGAVQFTSECSDRALTSDNDMIVLLSDLHIGATFENIFGIYNTDIAKEWMDKLLSNVLE